MLKALFQETSAFCTTCSLVNSPGMILKFAFCVEHEIFHHMTHVGIPHKQSPSKIEVSPYSVNWSSPSAVCNSSIYCNYNNHWVLPLGAHAWKHQKALVSNNPSWMKEKQYPPLPYPAVHIRTHLAPLLAIVVYLHVCPTIKESCPCSYWWEWKPFESWVCHTFIVKLVALATRSRCSFWITIASASEFFQPPLSGCKLILNPGKVQRPSTVCLLE